MSLVPLKYLIIEISKSVNRMTNGGPDDIFDELLKKGSIFENKEALQHTCIPDSLVHREEQVNSLASTLVSALKGDAPSNILISGKTGTGKTATTRYVCKGLEKKSESIGAHCKVIYSKCRIADNKYKLFAKLLSHFGEEIPNTGWPTDKVVAIFKEVIDSKKQVIIVILDDIDKLTEQGDNALDILSQINTGLENAKVSIIGITNDDTFTKCLDPRVKSLLGAESIHFPDYNIIQINGILREKAQVAYKENTIDDAIIFFCANLSSQIGDVKRALDLLRVSGEIAEHRKKLRVDKQCVREAYANIY